MPWFDVGNAADLADGRSLSVEVDGIPIVIARCGNDFYAVDDRCTHDGEALDGAEIESCQIICPRHGARFCLRTGEALTPPAYEPLRTYAAREENGRLVIEQPD
ncbi:MAG: Rieske (2Fe-2S) protein [Steroidobacteraceae bacterium]